MSRRLKLLTISLTFAACSGVDSDLPPDYRRIAVPAARLSSREARERGGVLYQSHCALCHGAQGDGRGVRSATLSLRPPDFRDPDWRWRTTPRHAFYVIREGKRGTPMASWKGLSEDDAWDLVAYVFSLPEAPRQP